MNITECQEWKDLQAHYQKVKDLHLTDLFDADETRARKFSLETSGLFLDYSKNLVTEETFNLFDRLLNALDFRERREQMFTGAPINMTERRSVLHTALRNRSNAPVLVDGRDVMGDVRAELDKMREFCRKVHSGEFVGYTGKKIRYVVNIGIGGSDLGPRMVTEALKSCHPADFPKVRYISNIDGVALFDTLQELDLEETLFLVASKTFSTMETMTNANAARQAVLEHYSGAVDSIKCHFVALSSNLQRVTDFGIAPENMFTFWDWVGGRYSLWSAIGLSIALYLGFDQFEELLDGAYTMDLHFRNAPLRENMPMIMAVLGVWYSNFFGWETHCVLPYSQHLYRFPSFLQQLDMESNGKRVTTDGRVVTWSTGPVVWGGEGTNCQHAFFQLIHQGTRHVPCDFILPINAYHKSREHQQKLIANCLAQSEALMEGKSLDVSKRELTEEGLTLKEVRRLAPHKVFEGNRPTNTILMRKLTPNSLGALIALYEHKVFAQGLIWGINSFDQFGVELGKTMAGNVLRELKLGVEGKRTFEDDTSTNSMLRWCMNNFE